MGLLALLVNRGTATLCLSFALFAWGFWTMKSYFAAEPFLRAGIHVETRGLPEATALERLNATHTVLLDRPGCRRDLGKAAATIRLARVDVLSAAFDAAVLEATDAAAKTLREDLSCRPADGNLWLRLAVVELRRQGITADVERYFRVSSWTMPTENWILADRIRFLGPIIQLGIGRLDDLYDRDVERYSRYADPGAVANLHLASPPMAQARQSAVWEQLGPKRVNELLSVLEAEKRNRGL